MRVLAILPQVLLVTTLLVCSYTDLKHRKVLNKVLFPAAMLALVLQVALQGGQGALIWLKGTLAGIALLLIPFLLGGIGAGDLKLLGVVGSFMGPGFVLRAFLVAALIGGLLSLIFLWKRKELKHTIKRIGGAIKLFLFSCFRVWNIGQMESEHVVTLPYAVTIALGTFLCLVGELW